MDFHADGGDLLQQSLNAINEFIPKYQYVQWKQAKLEEIKARMPATGGVLVVTTIETISIGEGSVAKRLRHARIDGAYASRKEAIDAQSLSYWKAAEPGDAVRAKMTPEPGPQVTLSTEYEWIPAHGPDPARLALPYTADEVASARKMATEFLDSSRKVHAARKKRLDQRWEELSEENARLNKVRREAKPKSPAAAEIAEAGRKEVEAWVAAEKKAIADERAAAAAAVRAAADAQKAAATWELERCPAGVTIAECTRGDHARWRQEFLDGRAKRSAQVAHHQQSAGQHARAADTREARLPYAREAKLGDVDVRVRAANAGKEAADALVKEQAVWKDRLRQFDEEDASLRQLAQTIKMVEELLGRLRESSAK